MDGAVQFGMFVALFWTAMIILILELRGVAVEANGDRDCWMFRDVVQGEMSVDSSADEVQIDVAGRHIVQSEVTVVVDRRPDEDLLAVTVIETR